MALRILELEGRPGTESWVRPAAQRSRQCWLSPQGGQGEDPGPSVFVVQVTVESFLAAFLEPAENRRRWFWRPQDTPDFQVSR